MRRIHLHLSDQQSTSLQRLSEQQGLARADLIRRAIDFYLAEQFKQTRRPLGGIRRGVRVIIPVE